MLLPFCRKLFGFLLGRPSVPSAEHQLDISRHPRHEAGQSKDKTVKFLGWVPVLFHRLAEPLTAFKYG
jgi:hypothetical protein